MGVSDRCLTPNEQPSPTKKATLYIMTCTFPYDDARFVLEQQAKLLTFVDISCPLATLSYDICILQHNRE